MRAIGFWQVGQSGGGRGGGKIRGRGFQSSRARTRCHWAVAAALRKPKWRTRCKPRGSTCWRKRGRKRSGERRTGRARGGTRGGGPAAGGGAARAGGSGGGNVQARGARCRGGPGYRDRRR